MKKFIYVICSLLFVLNGFGQKIIENPAFSATSVNNLKLQKVYLYDTVTKIDFELKVRKGVKIGIPKDTYIQNSAGGEKLFVKSTSGMPIGKIVTIKETGVKKYSLFFGPIDTNTVTIDFRENQWNVFDIELVPQPKYEPIPKELWGNWLKKDGSNLYVIGIYKDLIIYKEQVWEKFLLRTKGKFHELTLNNGNKSEKVFLKVKKDELLVGPHKNDLTALSTRIRPFTVEDNEGFPENMLKKGVADYKGYISGYHPKMGKTGIIYINNLISGKQDSEVIHIKENGEFSCKIPLNYPQVVLVKILQYYYSVYLEPEKSLFHVLNFVKTNSMPGDKEKKSFNMYFMGELGRVNYDLHAMTGIRTGDYKMAKKFLKDSTPEQYKDYYLKALARGLDKMAQRKAKNTISFKANFIKENELKFRTYADIMSYNMRKSSLERKKNKGKTKKEKKPFTPTQFPSDFFDFLDPASLNDPNLLALGGDFYIFQNRIEFSVPYRRKVVWPQVYSRVKDSVKAIGINLSKEESSLLDTLASSNYFRADSIVIRNLNKKISTYVSSILKDIYPFKHRLEFIANYYMLEEGLFLDFFWAQNYEKNISRNYEPLSEKDKKELATNIKTPFIQQEILRISDERAMKNIELEKSKTQDTGSVINEIPDVEPEQLFDAIMAKYKGKLIYVDFWATWCGPCRHAMKSIKPLKEELSGQDIIFVYLTNPSSPKNTWSRMIAEIDGEHYYLSQDQWNVLASQFGVSGIPHYVLVGKNGRVLEKKVSTRRPEMLKSMFNKHL